MNKLLMLGSALVFIATRAQAAFIQYEFDLQVIQATSRNPGEPTWDSSIYAGAVGKGVLIIDAATEDTVSDSAFSEFNNGMISLTVGNYTFTYSAAAFYLYDNYFLPDALTPPDFGFEVDGFGFAGLESRERYFIGDNFYATTSFFATKELNYTASDNLLQLLDILPVGNGANYVTIESYVNSIDLRFTSASVTSIPEPSSYALVFSATAFLLIAKRRRMQRGGTAP